MARHENNGACAKCMEIIFTFPDPFEPLVDWFVETQRQLPDLHCSEAGRGKARQERMYETHRSEAHWTESAHNWNCALDLFRNAKVIYDEDWFRGKLAKFIPLWLNWYGAPGSKFYELPHVEIRAWKELVKDGTVKLVEGA